MLGHQQRIEVVARQFRARRRLTGGLRLEGLGGVEGLLDLGLGQEQRALRHAHALRHRELGDRPHVLGPLLLLSKPTLLHLRQLRPQAADFKARLIALPTQGRDLTLQVDDALAQLGHLVVLGRRRGNEVELLRCLGSRHRARGSTRSRGNAPAREQRRKHAGQRPE